VQNNTNRSNVCHDVKSSSHFHINSINIFKRAAGYSLLGFGLVVSSLAFSAEPVWRDITPTMTAAKSTVVSKGLSKARHLALNESLLKEQLSQSGASQARQTAQAKSVVDDVIMSIPLPNGRFVRVRLEDGHVMSPALASKYPGLKTWKAVGVDKAITGSVDFTRYGFHAMLLMPDGDTVFVERKNKDFADVYRSFSRQENEGAFKQDFHCEIHDGKSLSAMQDNERLKKTAARDAAPKLINYRLAVAATGQYTQYHGGRGNALSAIVSTINRVNAINERDLGIHFQLIDNEDAIIYTQPLNDPYSNNQADIMLGENILNLQRTLGRSRYDVGHVFTQGDPSGLAILGSACDETSRTRFGTANGGDIELRGVKEAGMTGSPNPDGDAFSIDFVAHELGHQLGGKHTFNSTTGSCGGGNRTQDSAVEPGSGSTVMGYAGLSESNDLQKNSDDYYHTKSIVEILSYTRVDNIGTSCGSRRTTGNYNPEPDAGPDMVMPAKTPFMLTGDAFDPDGDDLSYVWEQMDTGTASDVDIDTGDNALIRSLSPSGSATRYIPRLKDIFQGRFIRGERLPVASRELNFAFTVRDGKGGIETDAMKVTVSGTGRPFALRSHGSPRNLGVGQQTKVSWDVAGTNAAPINCRTVDISLIRDNGQRVKIKGNTPNDGSETVTIPANAFGMSGARMLVACTSSASTFFNISTANLNIVSQGRGEADSANNNGAGSTGDTGGSSSGGSSSGGGAFGVVHIVLLMLLALLTYGIRKQPALRTRKIRVEPQHTGKDKKRNHHHEK